MIYLINLDRRTERLEFLNRRFLESDIKFTRISAVDGASLDDMYYLQHVKCVRSGYYPALVNDEVLRPNQLGCSLSHFKIYSELIQSENNFCVVLEDDIDFSDEFIEMLREIELNIPIDNPYIILFGYYKENQVNEKGKQSFLIKKRHITPNIKIGQPIEWYFGSHGYIINKKAAEIILEKFKVPTLPADYLLCYATMLGVKLRITQFPLVWINHLGLNESDIQLDKPTTFNQNKTVLKFGPRSLLIFLFSKVRELPFRFFNTIKSYCSFSEVPNFVNKMPIND